MSRPVGFWKFGTRYRSRARRPSRSQPDAGVVELVEIDAVGFLPDADHLGLDVAERGDRAGVGRQLDEDDVVRIEEHAGDEVESLLRAGGHEQAVEATLARRAAP